MVRTYYLKNRLYIYTLNKDVKKIHILFILFKIFIQFEVYYIREYFNMR